MPYLILYSLQVPFTAVRAYHMVCVLAAAPCCVHGGSLLVVNTSRLFALRAGLGPADDRYALEYLPAVSIPEGAELVSCTVVRRSSPRLSVESRGTPGMVCVAMLAPRDNGPVEPGTKQGDAAGGPAMRQPAPSLPAAPTQTAAASESSQPVSGFLNVYPIVGEKSFEVERALRRPPQQLPLPYVPVGVCHATVWRSAPPSSFVEAASSSPRDTYPSVERGDALLVWDQTGVVHGYTRWEGTLTDDGGGSGRVNRGVDGAPLLTAESRESLARLMPELSAIGGPVLCVAIDAEEQEGGVRRRQVIAGCTDGVHHVSFDAETGRKEAVSSFINGPVPALALNTCPSLFPREIFCSGEGGGSDLCLGFACSGLGTMASLVTSGGYGEKGTPRWCSGIACSADNDEVMCMSCADFCQDGSISVAVGTRLGKVMVYEVVADACENRMEETSEDKYDGGFGATCLDDGDSSSEASRRGESASPRPLGAERHHVTDRASPSAWKDPGLDLTARWQRDVRHPVWGISLGDLNHDGVREMVVATQFGVHVFRPDYREEASRLAKTLCALKMLEPEKAESVAYSSDEGPGAEVLRVGVH